MHTLTPEMQSAIAFLTASFLAVIFSSMLKWHKLLWVSLLALFVACLKIVLLLMQ
jgi:hypothetical protein